jgi:PPIC-type PPIASE domain
LPACLRRQRLVVAALVAASIGLRIACAQDAAPSFIADATAPAAPPDTQLLTDCEVIAKVNSEVILACELEWQVKLLFENRFGAQATEEMLASPLYAQARADLLKSFVLGRIEMALLYGDFRSNAPQADLEAIKRQLDTPFEETELPRLYETVGVKDREALEKRLLELGTSLAERREDFYRQMIARSWLTQQVNINKEVTHEQLLAFYEENKSDYDEPERVRWEELMVRYDSHPSKSEAYAALARVGNDAHAASAAAPAGEGAFAAIAPSRSEGFTAQDGGAHDWTNRGSLASPELNEALFSLAPGQMSPIVPGPVGFHIVRVVERKEAGLTPFRDVQAQIRKDLYDARFSAAVSAKMTELKKSARLWTAFTGDIDHIKLAELQKPPAR